MFDALTDFKLPSVDIPGFAENSPRDGDAAVVKSASRHDRYGFAIEGDDDLASLAALDMFNPMAAVDKVQEAVQEEKWATRMQLEAPFERDEDLTELVRSGVPDSYRANVWFELSGAKAKQASAPSGYYHALLEMYKSQRELNRRVEIADIEKDVDRTFPDNEKFAGDEGQWRLRCVLGPYAMRNRAVGYCQSMNFLTATLLLFQTEEQAFWMLATICEDILPGYWCKDLLPMKVDQHVFKELIARRLPSVSEHLIALGVSVEVLTTQWFLCIFLNSLCVSSALRVWDILFLQGSTAMFQAALALLHLSEDHILGCASMDEFVENVGAIAATGDDASVLASTASSSAVTGTALVQEVGQLRRKYKMIMLEEQRHQKRLAAEYREAQRIANLARTSLSTRTSSAEASTAQARSALADLAAMQRSIGQLATAMEMPASEQPSLVTEEATRLRTEPMAIEDVHFVVLGLRGVGVQVAKHLANARPRRITLVEHRLTEAGDVDNVSIQPEHKGSPLSEACKENLLALTGDATDVRVAQLDLALPSSQGLLREILQGGGGPGTPPVHAAFLCVDTATALVHAHRVCTSEAAGFAECNMSCDGSRGHAHICIPGASPCVDCAGELPGFLDHAVDPHGDGSALMFTSSTRSLLASAVVSHTLRAVVTGKWIPRTVCIDAHSNASLSDQRRGPDAECTNPSCQRMQRFQTACQGMGWPLQLSLQRGREAPEELCELDDAALGQELGVTVAQAAGFKQYISSMRQS